MWITLNSGIKIRKPMKTNTINKLTTLGLTFVWDSWHTGTCTTVHFLKSASYKIAIKKICLGIRVSACVTSTLNGGSDIITSTIESTSVWLVNQDTR